MRYELIDGDTRIINLLVKDGWKIENTFPNPYPQPYFFALMYLEDFYIEDAKGRTNISAENYNVENVRNHVYNGEKLNPWAAPESASRPSVVDEIPF